MKKWMTACCLGLAAAAAAGCGATGAASGNPAALETTVQRKEILSEDSKEMKQIRIEDGAGHAAVFELNGSGAAAALYAQLPLTVQVENFSSNEKIFYPAELPLTDTPHPAEPEAGVLAYYAPWGNVVMFYDSFRPNGDLYELGHAVAGTDQIALFSGELHAAAL